MAELPASLFAGNLIPWDKQKQHLLEMIFLLDVLKDMLFLLLGSFFSFPLLTELGDQPILRQEALEDTLRQKYLALPLGDNPASRPSFPVSSKKHMTEVWLIKTQRESKLGFNLKI